MPLALQRGMWLAPPQLKIKRGKAETQDTQPNTSNWSISCRH